MAQITKGVRAVLSHPAVYDFAQTLMGASRNRRWMQDAYFRARAGDRVLDVGCGTADILTVLPEVDYVGYDVSEPYIENARSRWGTRGRFFAALLDSDAMRSLGEFDLILATGLLHHLDDDEVENLFKILVPGLKPGGRIVTVDGTFVPGQNAVARWIISKDRGQNVRAPDAYAQLARSAFSDVKGHLIHRNWFPYTYWIMEISAPIEGQRGPKTPSSASETL
ncbi:class I SAM-dependent methyltransferase [Bosea sp. BK604]|uniref:class I SAM-dependent methyltransferase n=1 Tax=Bosea sp. BK604 TaxID=2512180 RepID=UPI00104D026F|nr:class I SAM-dependent methyltransferase [Bosea sp. BK604]TCR69998.1 methyltransferase family protein [Bosea sp. BK604]